MKKKYSDPLMFSSVLLSGIDIPPSGGEGGSPPDQAWSSKKSILSVNSNNSVPEYTEDVKIVPSAEETTADVTESPIESSGSGESAVIPEVAPVIDTLVEEEAATTGESTPAPAE